MDNIFVGFDWSEDLAKWALNMLDVKLSTTVETIPHVLDQVLVADHFLVLPILTHEVSRHELRGILEQLIDSLNDVSIEFHFNLETFKIDIRLKVDQAVLKFFDYVVHEH